jgi:hypothetical protein
LFKTQAIGSSPDEVVSTMTAESVAYWSWDRVPPVYIRVVAFL